MTIPLCKSDCPRRKAGCHVECEEYRAYKTEYEDFKAKRAANTRTAKLFDEYGHEQHRRIVKRMRDYKK